MRLSPSSGQVEPVVLFDGAMGTLLGERGFELCSPLFSARALLEEPELIVELHWEYLLAGAQVLTTNSFNLHVQTLASAGLAQRQAELATRSVELLNVVRQLAFEHARESTEPDASLLGRFRIAASIPPRPQTRSEEPALARAEYGQLARVFADAGADLIVLETFTDTREARLALEGIARAGVELPIWLSLVAGFPVPGSRRLDGSRLVSGESFDALAPLFGEGAPRVLEGVLLNCVEIDAVPVALDQLIAHVPEPILLGLSPHLGKRRYDGVWIERIVETDVLAEQMEVWLRPRPRFVVAGACCGSRPVEIAAMRKRLQPNAELREQAFVRLAGLLP